MFSNYVNAWTIKKGLQELQLDLLCKSDESGLLECSGEIPQFGDVLFFTEENSLKSFYESQHTYHFYPKGLPFSLIDDKLEFARALDKIGELPIPYGSIEVEPGLMPIYVKARHSWQDGYKLPRGYICKTPREYQNVIRKIALDYHLDWFFLQKLLPGPISNNISTCGFFDSLKPERNMIIVTKKIWSQQGKIGTGCIVQTIRDPRKLIERTANILSEFDFSGPFELEFFYDKKDDLYYVLELNPRFWMQHGLFVKYFNNGLIKRYLDLDTPEDWLDAGVQDNTLVTWFDNVALLTAVVKVSPMTLIKYIQLIIDSKINDNLICFYPAPKIAIVFVFKHLLKRITRGKNDAKRFNR